MSVPTRRKQRELRRLFCKQAPSAPAHGAWPYLNGETEAGAWT